jgi:hypothetical protein
LPYLDENERNSSKNRSFVRYAPTDKISRGGVASEKSYKAY